MDEQQILTLIFSHNKGNYLVLALICVHYMKLS